MHRCKIKVRLCTWHVPSFRCSADVGVSQRMRITSDILDKTERTPWLRSDPQFISASVYGVESELYTVLDHQEGNLTVILVITQ